VNKKQSWLFVNCGGIRAETTSGLLMSHFSRTDEWKIDAGFGISRAMSAAGRGLAKVYISTNCKKSPEYSRRIRPSSASANHRPAGLSVASLSLASPTQTSSGSLTAKLRVRKHRRNPARRPVAMSLLGGATAGLIGLTVYAVATDVRMREPAEAVAKAPPAPPPAGPIQKLEVARLYAAHCAACHGVDGSGNTPVGKTLKARDLRSAEVSKLSDEEIARIVKNGKGKMPAYQGKISEADIDALVKLIRTFKK